MKICCIGCGYVGLVAATCLADMGNDVLSVDIDKNKIDNLKKGIIPIYEPGLKDMLDRNAREKGLSFRQILKKVFKNQKLFLLPWEHLLIIIIVRTFLPLPLLLKV